MVRDTMELLFRKQSQGCIAGVILFWLAGVNIVSGQVWTDHNSHDPGIVYAQATIPAFEESFIIDSPSSIYELYARLYIGNRLAVIGSFPVSHYSSSAIVGGRKINETAAGNPFLGVRFESISPGLSLETGFRLPLAPDNLGVVTGLLVEDFAPEAFLSESPSVKVLLRYNYGHGSGFTFQLGGGPNYWMVKDAENEMVLNYYSQMHYQIANIKLGIGFTGIGILSEADLSLDERTDHYVGFMSSYSFKPMRVSGFVKVPLDKQLRDNLNYSIGLSLAIILDTSRSRVSERLRHRDRAIN